MPAERVSMKKIRDVLRLTHTMGMSRRKVSEATGIGRVAGQRREHPCTITGAVAADLGDGQLGIVVQDRVRPAAEIGEGRDVAIEKRFRRLGRVRLDERRVRMRQVIAQAACRGSNKPT